MDGYSSSSSLQRIMKDIRQLNNQPLEGIRLIVNDDNLSSLYADIDGPCGTPYTDGLFRIKLFFQSDYPNSPPKGNFLTKIFHPNVDWKTGDICVNTLKKDWNNTLGIRHLLMVIRCLLIVPNPESALNEEAGKLLLDNFDDFSKRAALLTKIHAKKPLTASTNSANNNSNNNNTNTIIDDNSSSSSSSSSGSSSVFDHHNDNVENINTVDKKIIINNNPSTTTAPSINKPLQDKKNNNNAAAAAAAQKKKSLKRL